MVSHIEYIYFRTLQLVIENLPNLPGEFFCAFNAEGKSLTTKANRTTNGVSCTTPRYILDIRKFMQSQKVVKKVVRAYNVQLLTHLQQELNIYHVQTAVYLFSSYLLHILCSNNFTLFMLKTVLHLTRTSMKYLSSFYVQLYCFLDILILYIAFIVNLEYKLNIVNDESFTKSTICSLPVFNLNFKNSEKTEI